MKTWIIILFVAFLVFKLVSVMCANYIRNDKTEAMKYYFTKGATVPGVLHGLFWLLSWVALGVDAVLVLIYLL